MNKEYGGYIEWERYDGEEYHDGYCFDSVRSAFLAIISAREYRHILLPVYLCSCFREIFDITGVKYTFYNIDKNLKPILNEERISNDSCLFLVNYFGQLDENYIIELSSQYNVFLDNTQAFFNASINGIDMANSCRKYLGVADGAYLYSSCNIDMEDYNFNNVIDKVGCLVGRFEENASNYYSSFVKNETIVRGKPIKRMSKFTHNVLKSLDYKGIINKRKDNFSVLDKLFTSINELEINNNAGLFMYPLLVKRGLDIKKELISRKVYVPTLWSNVVELPNCSYWERRLVEDIIWLPIDQRYDQNDMEAIGSIVCDLMQ